MADNQVTITYNDDLFTADQQFLIFTQTQAARYTGSLTADYTTGTFSGNVDVSGDGFSAGDSFTGTLIESNGSYTAQSNHFTLRYDGQTPTTAFAEYLTNTNDDYRTDNNPAGQQNQPVSSSGGQQTGGGTTTPAPSGGGTQKIAFNDDLFTDARGDTATYTGSFQVDYDANTYSGNVQVDGDGLGAGLNISGALGYNNGTYTISGSNFTLNYTGQQPTTASAEFVVNNNEDYKTSLNPAGQQDQPVTTTAVSGSDSSSSNPGSRTEANTVSPVSAFAVCFGAGTRIRTARGDVPVEDLAIGDLAVTSSGAHRPIRWLGHREVDCRRHPRPHEVLPVRVAAHAFAPGRPARDLFLSPGHAIGVDLVGTVLIPALSLVNGATIEQVEVERVTYWHVELDAHDVVLAENLPAESYLEMGNRGFFLEAGAATILHGSPDAAVPTHDAFCRPFHVQGPLVDFARRRLVDRAAALGWALEEVPLAGLHLVVGGVRVEPQVRGLAARFTVPAGATEVWLVSDTGMPAAVGLGPDHRSLGVCVGALTFDDGFGASVEVAADDPRLVVGFDAPEDGSSQRWTRGRARLPAELWCELPEGCHMRVDLARPALPRWTRAEAAPRMQARA